MLRAVARLSAALTGAAVAVAALAVPASADGYVPDGCVGSVVYACTGAAMPPGSFGYPEQQAIVPVTFHAPSVQVLPSRTVGGQQIGGVIVSVGPQSVGVPTVVVGPTSPIQTGVVLPVNVCALTVCLESGTPVTVPGLPLPVIPVSLPGATVPGQQVPVPLVTVPTQTTQPVVSPSVDQRVVTTTLYVNWQDLYGAAVYTCRMGGGDIQSASQPPYHEQCVGSTTAPAADALLAAYWVASIAYYESGGVRYGAVEAAYGARDDAEGEIARRVGWLTYYVGVLGEIVP